VSQASPEIATAAVALPADFGSRFSAFVIDAALLFAAQWTVVIVAARQLQAAGLSSANECGDPAAAVPRMCEGPSTVLWAFILMFLLVSTVGYHAFFEGHYGATPGKRLMGLRVARATGDEPIDLTVAALRSLVRQLFWLLPFFLFDVSPLSLGLPAILILLLPLGALAVFIRGAVHPDGRGVHDVVAGTKVVRVVPAHGADSGDDAVVQTASASASASASAPAAATAGAGLSEEPEMPARPMSAALFQTPPTPPSIEIAEDSP